MLKFQKTVSKGSRFNQIYVPKSMEGLIGAGDEVEVRLIRKRVQLHYSKGLKLSEFKEKLVRDVFSALNKVPGVEKGFIVGSFLTEKTDYNDIDIIIITSSGSVVEAAAYNQLMAQFDLKFHLVLIEEKQFERLLKICPLTKSMLSSFVCSESVRLPPDAILDENHLRFLLIMPADLLHIKIGSRAFFDSMRRLATIERFLKGRSLDTAAINSEVESLVGNQLYQDLKSNTGIEPYNIALLRKIIKEKLAVIEKLIKNGKKQGRSGAY